MLNNIECLEATHWSILHFMKNEEEGIYTVQDTAKEKTLVSLIQAKPWAVILPDKDHKITLIEEEIEQAPMEIDETNILFQDKTYIINVLKEGMKFSRRGLRDNMKVSKKKKAEQYVLTIKI